MVKKLMLLVFMLSTCMLKAQLVLNAQLPAAGFVQKDQLWNLVIVNNKDAMLTVTLQLNLQDAATGQPVLTAGSGNLLLPKGVKTLNARDIQPILYNYLSADMSRDYLAMGSYIACYQVLGFSGTETQEVLAQECIRFNIDPLSPPLLNTPNDKAELQTPYPRFTWMPPTPFEMFTNLNYELLVTEVLPGQSATEAIQYNTPLYSRTNLTQPYEMYPASFTKLDTGKTYAWQVIASNGLNYAAKTEVWTFSLKEDSISKNISLAPFIKLNKRSTPVSKAYQGFLKMEVINNTIDSLGSFIVRNVTAEKRNVEFKFKTTLVSGQNFIQYDMSSWGKLNDKDVYEVEFADRNGESWYMKFTPVYYH